MEEYERNCMTFQLLYAFHQTPFGKCLIAVTDTDEAVAYLIFIDDDDETEAIKDLKTMWSLSRTWEDGNRTGTVVEKIFYPVDCQPRLVRILMKGTEFRIRVWRSLTRIPEGTVVSYKEVARMVDSKPIAVGSAIAKNYIAYVVPCHRVVPKCTFEYPMYAHGKYIWGVERKKAIIEYENHLKS